MSKDKKMGPALEEVLAVQSSSYQEEMMTEYICGQLDKIDGVSYYKEIIPMNNNRSVVNIYATKGELSEKEYYPCFVSHTDTVHDIIDRLEIRRDKNKEGQECLFGWSSQPHPLFKNFKYGQPAGCGGDDKVGIWACLNLITMLDKCKLAFFSAEEVGTVGSGQLNKDFFKDVGYALQTDRKGNEDFVTKISGTDLSSVKFQSAISPILNKRKYKLQPMGGLTDVKSIKTKKIDICVANISSGYYKPHTDNEYVVVPDAYNALGLMYDIAVELGNSLWSHKAKEFSFSRIFYNEGDRWSGTQQSSLWGNDPFVDTHSDVDYTRRHNAHGDNYDWDDVNSGWEQKNQTTKCTKGKCKVCADTLRKLGSHEVCLECDVMYTMDFYENGGFVDNDGMIYPVVASDTLDVIGYYDPFTDKLYYKPMEVPENHEKEYTGKQTAKVN